MPETKFLNIKDIKLDLNNYRTIPQKNEEDGINAMIAIKPERFYAVVESLIEDGYLPTENLIILNDGGYIVKEGNRRTAAMKLIHGIYSANNFGLPESLRKLINSVSSEWKKENTHVPCSIYKVSETAKVEKIVNLTHAKGEKASRDPWTSVAKARQNRDQKKGVEPALDLLEKYLEHGNNLTNQQRDRWSGDYPLTVLEEALRHIVPRLKFDTANTLITGYPKLSLRTELEGLLRDIGLQAFGFKEIRAEKPDFAEPYGIPPLPAKPTQSGQQPSSASSASNVNKSSTVGANGPSQPSSSTSAGSPGSSATSSSQASTTGTQASGGNQPPPPAFAIYDQRTVTQTLKKFNVKGSDRQKLVSLRDELMLLKVKKNPIAFCFLLRSMFEISASIYCKEKSIPTEVSQKNGDLKQRQLAQLLTDVTTHLTANNSNKGMVKTLHGANAELTKPTGLLSVTSMNQLVHNTSFSIAPHDIYTLFNNVYPLLEAMN
ncbi:hypothetical protein [Dyadobacter pollutisoli]|uniref:ParB/Sulfiredoxin domain-containing protein n=1 Tax=Dyadobacter pollutisoli TaxID=2910158 RepID=A0A9E8NBA9_9BACT|nr:hypothetical protein [Dyadobacter pollutisoli]WAC11902.1 hypothetical protein ON006_29745 [Dyadobacter pollutisoli]